MLEKSLSAVLALLFLTGVAPPDNGPAKLPAPPPQTTQSTNKIEPPKPMDLTWDQQQGVFLYGKNSILNQCIAQPSNLWCSNIRLPEKTLTPWQIMNISLDTKANFKYVADKEDSWRVHSSSVLTKSSWSGDCDDLTSTTLDMMIRQGQPRNKAWFVLADVEHKSTLDHLIGMVQDANGDFWIIGDTSAQNAYPATQLKYRIVGIASAADPETWLDPHMLPAFPASTLQSNPIAPPPPAPIVVNLPTVDELLRLRK